MRSPWGGSSGIYLSPSIFEPLGGPAQALWVIYFLMVAVMGLSLYLSYAIKTSKFGLGLLAIGQNEDAASVLGVPTPRYKALVYSISAFLPAVAGGLYFFKSAFIQPSDAFDLSLSTEALVVAMRGGQGTVTGVSQTHSGFILEFGTAVPTKVLCDLDYQPPSVHVGDTATVTALAADAQRASRAVRLKSCSLSPQE